MRGGSRILLLAAAAIACGFAVGRGIPWESPRPGVDAGNPAPLGGARPPSPIASARKAASQERHARLVRLASQTEPRQFARRADGLASDPRDRKALMLLLERWTRDDPEAAFAKAWELAALPARRQEGPSESSNYNREPLPPERFIEPLIKVAEVWAESDPEAALERLSGLPSCLVRDRAMMAVVEVASKSDPQNALAFLVRFPIDAGDTWWKLQEILSDAAKSDAHATSQRILDIRMPSTRELAAAEFANAWARTDFAEALEWAQSLPLRHGSLREKAVDAVGDAIASWTGDQAAFFCRENPNHDFTEKAVVRWAESDLNSALGWMQSRSNPRDRLRMAKKISESLRHGDEPLKAAVEEVVSDPDLLWFFERENSRDADPFALR